MRLLESLAQALGLGRGTVVILLGVGGLLLFGTVKRAIWLRRRAADEDDRRRWRSAVTWWVLFLDMVAALVLGRWAVVLLTVALSIQLLRETLRLAGAEARGGRAC